MRPTIIATLESLFRTNVFQWLVPTPMLTGVIAVLATQLLFIRGCTQVGIHRRSAAIVALIGLVIALFGSRAIYVVQNWDGEFHGIDSFVSFRNGTASWGAYAGAVLGLVLGCRLLRIAIRPCADALAWAAGMGIAIGRIGCYLNGDDFGKPASIPWAVQFPPDSYAYIAQVKDGILDPRASASLPVHPVQLYLALNGLLLFTIVTRSRTRLLGRPGATFSLYLTLYCISRFILEFFRGDQVRMFHETLTFPQIYALGALIPASICFALAVAGGSSARRYHIVD